MLKASDFKVGDAVYGFVDESTGENVHVASGQLREWCLKHQSELEVYTIPVLQEWAHQFINDNSVLMVRVMELVKNKSTEPIIHAKWGTFTNGAPDVILVDGHHRYVAAAIRGDLLIESYLIERPIWEQFRIEGFAKLTQEQMKAIPVAKRNYSPI